MDTAQKRMSDKCPCGRAGRDYSVALYDVDSDVNKQKRSRFLPRELIFFIEYITTLRI